MVNEACGSSLTRRFCRVPAFGDDTAVERDHTTNRQIALPPGQQSELNRSLKMILVAVCQIILHGEPAG